MPVKIGPIEVAPPKLPSNLYAIFPEVKSGNINTFAGPFNAEKPYDLSNNSEDKAKSACISPSISISGRNFFTMPVALQTLSDSECLVL